MIQYICSNKTPIMKIKAKVKDGKRFFIKKGKPDDKKAVAKGKFFDIDSEDREDKKK